VTVTNHLHETSRLSLALDVDTEFADLFEVKDGIVAEREVTCTHDDASLTLSYARGDFAGRSQSRPGHPQLSADSASPTP
jgi:hypothetical protein